MSFRIIGRSIWRNPGNKGRRLRKVFAALSWQLYKRIVRRPKAMTLVNGTRFYAHSDCVVSSALHYADWPEYEELHFCRSRLRPEDIVLDVGANVGHLSLLLADVVKPENIYCFEPTPVTFRRLRDNWSLNGWGHEQLHHLALGAASGRMFIADEPHPITTNSVHTANGGPGDVTVEVRPLDAMCSLWRGRSVGLLKVDVEGFEKEVFAGSRAVLTELRPRLIMFESLEGKIEPAIAEILRATRYQVFELDGQGRPDFVHLQGQNLFAVPEELVAGLQSQARR